jgi:2-methylcitrate dehydratase PrpD
MTFESSLAEWAATASVGSRQARALAQEALLDVTGCIIGGSVEAPTRAVIDMARRFGTGGALAMGSAQWMAAPWAALVSGAAAHALDFDDNFGPATTHATAVLAPALFALADEDGSSGTDVIDAYVVGLEVQARIGRLVNPGHYEKGWHATSTVGAIGTAAGCARLLGLDAGRTLASMSIAFSMASGSRKQFGSMMKPIHAGLAAKNAVLAVRMAQAGICGHEEPLTGAWGFAGLYGDNRETGDAKANVPEESKRILAIESDGLLAKRFPCCGAAHRTLDGLVELRQRHGLSLEAVERIEAVVPVFARDNLRFDDPRNEMEARFSLTYPAVRVLQAGALTLSDMTLDKVRDPSIRPWLQRVVIHTKPGSVAEELGENATPAITRVVMRSGDVHEVGIGMPKGSRQAPLTQDEQRAKFRDCCRWAGKERDADRLFEIASSIHSVRRFRDFSQLFAQAYSDT